MKNKMLAVIVIAVALVVSGLNLSLKSSSLSKLSLANIEALANNESGGSGTIYCCGNYGECMKVVDSDGKIHVVAGVRYSTPCP